MVRVAPLRKNGCNDRYKTFRVDDQWLSDRAIKFVWQPRAAMGRGAEFPVAGDTCFDLRFGSKTCLC